MSRLQQIHKQRVAKSKQLKNHYFVTPEIQKIAETIKNQETDYSLRDQLAREMDDFYNIDFSPQPVNHQEVQQLLNQLEAAYSKEKIDGLIASCKENTLNAIIGPFGLSDVFFKDKEGGNVTTIHNFEKGITATQSDQERYNEWSSSQSKINRDPYDHDPSRDKSGNIRYNENGEYRKSKFNDKKKKELFTQMAQGEKVIDGYTGKELGTKEGFNINKKAQIDLEHITSVKEIETDSKNHLFATGRTKDERLQDRVDIARDDRNLTLAEGSMNSSKNDKDLLEWANSTNRKDKTKTNAEYYGVDQELMLKEYAKSKQFIGQKQRRQQLHKQGKEVFLTSAKESVKMGTQQAFGLLLKEFAEAIFDEVSDIYHHGFRNGMKVNDSFLSVLKQRLVRIKDRLLSKWKDVVKAFGNGFISGFFSNIITTIVNMFKTTSAKVVKMIREGIFSLLRAIKMVLFPPKHLTRAEAAHEATKLIVAGLVTMGGIALEEVISKKLTAMAMPFADHVSGVIIGILSGLAIALLTYLLDELDIFGVERDRKNTCINQQLDSMLEGSVDSIEDMLGKLEFPKLIQE